MDQFSVLMNGALAIAAVVCIRQHTEMSAREQQVDIQLATLTTPEPEILTEAEPKPESPEPEAEPELRPEKASEAAPLQGPQFCETADAPTQFASSAQPQARHGRFPLYELSQDVLGAVLGHLDDTCLARCARVSRAMLRVQVDADRILWQPRVTKLLQSPEMDTPPGGVALWRLVMSVVPREFAAGRVEMVPVRRGTFLAGETLEERTIEYTYWMDVYPVTCARFAAFAAAHRWR